MQSSDLVHYVTIMGVLGIPSIFSMTIWCVKQCRRFTKQLKILAVAQKAQMRSELLKDFQYYMLKGYITDIELREWQNQHEAYHDLQGSNGVLDDRLQKLMDLPSEPKEVTVCGNEN